MALSYYFYLNAPGTTSASDLEAFLKTVERHAAELGFNHTEVLNVAFDSSERREFARRLGGGMSFEHEALKGVVIPSCEDVVRHDPVSGTCRLVPQCGVVLVVTDERGCETCLGFFRYPAAVRDVNGKARAETGFGSRWAYHNYVDTPDPRFRQLVKMFKAAGFVESETDEYAPMPGAIRT